MSQQVDPKYIEELVHRFRNGHIDTAELNILMDWYTMHDDRHVEIPLGEGDQRDQVKARILSELTARIRQDRGDKWASEAPLRHQRKSVSIRRWSVAAAVLVFAVVAGWAVWEFLDGEDKRIGMELLTGQSPDTISPG